METKTAVRLGEFEILSKTNKYDGNMRLAVLFEIAGKKAKMTLRKNWKQVEIEHWYFITGDSLIDETAKKQTDFSAFELVDIIVDTYQILKDAAEFIEEEKRKEREKAYEQEKIEREKKYKDHFFIMSLKPALETKGHTVIVSTTKEEFINGSELTLRVDENTTVEYDYYGQIEARSFDREYTLRVTEYTKSKKVEKIVAMVENAINIRKRKINELLKEKEDYKNTQQMLKDLLNVDILEKKKWNRNIYKSNSPGYETTYFEDEASLALFTKEKDGFRLTPNKVLSPNKVKRIYEILRKEE